MTNSVTPFEFKGANVRTIEVDGDPWFVAADVCLILELGNPRSSLALLDDDERGVHAVDTPGGLQEVTIINEPGLYSLVLRSRKEEAKEFKRWITREVLPQIRKTGSYGSAVELRNPALQQVVTLALQMQATQDEQERLARVQNEQGAQLNTLAAKVSASQGEHDEFTTLAYARLNDLPTDKISCQRHGQRASRLMRSRGLEPRKVQDAIHGTVNVYPIAALEATAEA